MHMADPQLTMVERLVRHVLLPRERLPQIEINSSDGRSIYSSLSRVKSGGGAVYLLAVAGLIACKDVGRFEAFTAHGHHLRPSTNC